MRARCVAVEKLASQASIECDARGAHFTLTRSIQVTGVWCEKLTKRHCFVFDASRRQLQRDRQPQLRAQPQ